MFRLVTGLTIFRLPRVCLSSQRCQQRSNLLHVAIVVNAIVSQDRRYYSFTILVSSKARFADILCDNAKKKKTARKRKKKTAGRFLDTTFDKFLSRTSRSRSNPDVRIEPERCSRVRRSSSGSAGSGVEDFRGKD